MEESAATLAFTPNYNPGFLYRKEDPVDDLAWEVGVLGLTRVVLEEALTRRESIWVIGTTQEG